MDTQRKPNRLLLAAVLAAACLQSSACAAVQSSATPATSVPAPAADEPPGTSAEHETAVLAGGCFWGMQGVFEHVRGVDRVVAGYAGGTEPTAHYEMVSSGVTGHAESVQVTYEPSQISYGHLLQIYFSVAHDPTQLNRQGPDVGTQYRSVIFAQNEMQKQTAQAYVTQLNQAGVFDTPIVTQIDSAHEFFPAEPHHQDFLNSNPTNPYIVVNDLPKLDSLKRRFPDVYREQPVLARAES